MDKSNRDTILLMFPAFDGTGLMFEQLSKNLKGIKSVPIPYPETGSQDYESLVKRVSKSIPSKEDYFLLGESFAGPLIYRLALSSRSNCKGVIFVATYLTTPSPWIIRVLSIIPAVLVSYFITRAWVVKLLALSDKAPNDVAQAIANNFKQTEPTVIKARLRAIGKLGQRKPVDTLPMKCYCIQASKDRLVPAKKRADFEEIATSLTLFQISGGHFVLQESPQESAKLIYEKILKL